MIKKRWQIAKTLSQEAEQNLAKYPALLRQILFNRGFADEDAAKHFLAAITTEDHTPFLLLGMEAAVERLERAISSGEQIVVYGDYDADGVTASALLVQCLQALDAEVRHYIPDRFAEGYGLNIKALRLLKEDGAKVIVTVDCGIRAVAQADEANQLGLDLIITDHHTPGPELPAAVAIINSKLEGDEYKDSPYYRQRIPDLNGAKAGMPNSEWPNGQRMFLRGSVNSGLFEKDTTRAPREQPFGTVGGGHTHPYEVTTKVGNGLRQLETQTAERTKTITPPLNIHTHRILGGDKETRPVNMSVVWIMRVK